MPTYVYECRECGELFEVQASFKEKERGLKPPCPACHHKHARQVLTAGLVIRASSGSSAGQSSCSPGCSGDCGSCHK